MTLDALQAKSEELQGRGFKLVYASEDGYFQYFIDDHDDKLFSVSADVAASAAFAHMCVDDPDNTMLPHIYNFYEEDGVHITVMERLCSIMEMEGATEGHYGRVGRNYTNYLAGHDPARGTDNDHTDVFNAFDKSRKLQSIGSAMAKIMRQSYEDADAESLMFDRSRQHMMYRLRDSKKKHDFVYMHPLRSVNVHTQSFIDRFNRSSDAAPGEEDKPVKTKHLSHTP